ncbi:MAG: hypothetical protein MUW56_01630 [Chryseobacterium sp.]|uniref:hypothetical protein n=1 Tax=Chryseobacterium sp. TaxID=1871047 RepID=UPI0025C71463|nr:hypothetical protein [Chryseobacterium sp.]MCJ7932351.1 hypothetical protein [Chryseobacterium sp.]
MKTLRRALVPLAMIPLKNIAYALKKDSIPIKVRAFLPISFRRPGILISITPLLLLTLHHLIFRAADYRTIKWQAFSR